VKGRTWKKGMSEGGNAVDSGDATYCCNAFSQSSSHLYKLSESRVAMPDIVAGGQAPKFSANLQSPVEVRFDRVSPRFPVKIDGRLLWKKEEGERRVHVQ
jgi:hypothetical protein